MEVGDVVSITVRRATGADFSREIGVSDVATEERVDDCGSGSGCDEGGVVADVIVTARSLEIAFRETCSKEDSRVGKDVQFGPTLDAAETVRFVGDSGETL